MQRAKTIYLNEYQPNLYHITECTLTFDIFDEKTVVRNVMQIERTDGMDGPLYLDGRGLQLDALHCDGEVLPAERYRVSEEGLTIDGLPDACVLDLVTLLYPDTNTALEGLYRSGEILCTQNEPEGFRRITYFIDRPDNMTRFTTKVIADKRRYPILLSNGNRGESGELSDGRHWMSWEDPFVKPSYLFALVAGELGSIHDTFTTMSDREIELTIYCDPGNEAKCHHAMRSLKASMLWDEEEYGREYDLDIYNIVAVDSFNMGAMENKGLNIFNSHYVLADEQSATDQDFLGIESVIAHEYFHNWTGNRITCRDWFQLTLKEGLTVFRDQCFSADMNSEVVQRISDVKALRERQFVEDAGPTAHPIKPDHYIEINNFYTATVYEKGAEVIRMIHTMLGKKRFRAGMDLYFDTFDGQAVTTEDFIWAMSEGGDLDLEPFIAWYHQERTPELLVEEHFDAAKKEFMVKLTQKIPDDVNHRRQEDHVYPLGLTLFDDKGDVIPLQCKSAGQSLLASGRLLVREHEEAFIFSDVQTQPRLSLNHGFTAPVIVHQKQVDLPFLMMYENDGFSRYEAARQYAIVTLQTIMDSGRVDDAYVRAYGHLLADTNIDRSFKAQLLELPSVSVMMQTQQVVEVYPIYEARNRLLTVLAERYRSEMIELFDILYEPDDRAIDAQSMGRRALKNRVLGLLMHLNDPEIDSRCIQQYYQSVTMTDRIGALDLLENHLPEASEAALSDFYETYHTNILVMNKYFSIRAASERPGAIDRVRGLESDPVFDMRIPNLVRSLYGVFARNHLHFHDVSGEGYRLIAQKVIELDTINPQIASGLTGAFKMYDKMHPDNQYMMRTELEKVLAVPKISRNVIEIVEKILAE